MMMETVMTVFSCPPVFIIQWYFMAGLDACGRVRSQYR
jgi:hypothetical protein